jgi:hypothetical protein
MPKEKDILSQFLEYLGGYFSIECFSFSSEVDNLTPKKSILKKGTEKVHSCISGQAFSVCFLLIFIL